jgi:hypothetical protein
MSTMRSHVENWIGGGSRQMFIVQFRPIIQSQKLKRPDLVRCNNRADRAQLFGNIFRNSMPGLNECT